MLNTKNLLQERLFWKDFNIVHEAKIAEKPVVIPVNNVSVTNNVLEIQFYFAGKGTTRIPERGVYGPLISAISVVSRELFLWLSLSFYLFIHFFADSCLNMFHKKLINIKAHGSNIYIS